MRGKIRQYIHDISENNRIIIFNIIGSFSVKGAALLLSLFTMPAYIKYFNNQTVLGIWFTILSVLSWILNFDLGIGNGLRNHLTASIAKKDYISAKKYISSAYISIGAVVILISSIFLTTYKYINWNIIFNINAEIISKNALNLTVIIVFLGIMLQFFFKLISSILYSLQKSFVNNFLALCTSLITFIYVSVSSPGDDDKNMVTMAVVHTLAVVLPLIITTLIIFIFYLKESRPSVCFFTIEHMKKVLSLGGIFFFVQVVYMLIMSTNEYLITYFTNSSSVVEYQVYNKLFTFTGTVFTLTLTPIWSAVTRAVAQKNFLWLRKLYKKLLIFGFFGCVIEFLTIPFIQTIVDIWLKEKTIHISYMYCLVFAGMGSLMILNSVLSSMANGVGELKSQAIFFGIGAVIKIPLAYVFVSMFNSWIGVVMANFIAMAIYCIVQPFWFNKYVKNIENREMYNE